MIKKIVLCALLAPAVFAAAWAATTQSAQEKTFAVSQGGQFTLKSARGDVEVRLWDRNEVAVVARGADPKELRIEQSGNQVTVDYRGRGRNVGFEVQAPFRFNLDLSTGGGDIRITGNLEGRLDLDTLGGDISFSEVKGEAYIDTNGGDIQGGSIAGNSKIGTLGGDIDLGHVDGTLEVTTQGGDISVRGVASTMKAETLGGDIDVGDVGGEADVSTLGGDVTVGRVSGKATLKTLGGDVELRSSSGDVIANTAGGDIRLREVSGSIEASTAGGDIDAQLTGASAGGSSLVSRGGDITLYVPGDARFTVEAKIRLSGSSHKERQERRFISDFPAAGAIRETASEISATYQINGGGALITLETSNGNIQIRRGR